MKYMLYHVTCYHKNRNEWTRILLSVRFVEDRDEMRRDAERGALDNLESAGFTVDRAIEVCRTNDKVYLEAA